MADMTPGELMTIMILFIAIIAGGLGWFVRYSTGKTTLAIWKITKQFNDLLASDHVHRAEFDKLDSEVRRISERQAAVIAILNAKGLMNHTIFDGLGEGE